MFKITRLTKLLSIALFFSILLAQGCTKSLLLNKGEKMNKELEGNWEIEGYFLNDADASIFLEDTYITFAPSVNSSLEGQFTTNRKDQESTFQDYVLNDEGSTITIEDSESNLSLEGSLLTVEQTVIEDGVKVTAILVLDKQ